ncbi:sodium/potassium/calcium exchanger 5-like [Lycorma delicatula]|uniref:sodium/potassium/calcium exchanger 5-like n=1 Tax=Lycorma delicatula TaxID=130591 RepID=UPI003F51121A
MREWDQGDKCLSKIRQRPASFLILIPIVVMFINTAVYYWKVDQQKKVSLDITSNAGRRMLLNDYGSDLSDVEGKEEENCTRPAILEFPQVTIPGGKPGQLIFSFMSSIYLYILLAKVCDDYFIASIKIVCSKIGFTGDVAGATLLAAATSSPELFVNFVGTFVTRGDIGVGTIIGSAVFNILAVPGLCSVFAISKAIKLDSWPLIRDSLAYCVSLFILCFVLQDGLIYWYEALFMVVTYTLYLVMMHYNDVFREKFKSCVIRFTKKTVGDIWEDPVTWPLMEKKTNGHVYNGIVQDENSSNIEEDQEQEKDYGYKCCWLSENSIVKKMWWLFTLPITIMLTCTIPDCQKEIWRKLYMLTFLMSVCWIAVGSYLITWMITISGYVLKIPDSVMGLTFIAAGMCIPETLSSIIVSKQGKGSMALANSLGSNIFDTLFCFGLPWLIKTTYFRNENHHYMEVHSSGLDYNTVILLVTLLLLFAVVAANKFTLTKLGGYLCLLMYFIFIGFSVGVELYVHFCLETVPICDIE